MKQKKVLAVLLASAMVMGALSGCGEKESVNSSSTPSKAQSVETSKTESNADGEKELDVIRVFGMDRYKTFPDGTTVYFSDWVSGKVESKLWDQFCEDLAERGIQLEINLIPEDQYATVIQTQVAAGLDCDWIYLGSLDSKTRYSLIDRGVIVPINEIWENYSETADEYFKNGYGKALLGNTAADGNLYWLGALTVGLYGDHYQGAITGCSIRKDWLDKLNLPMPTTTDELFDTLLAFQEQDANGNGLKDEVANVNIESFDQGFAQMHGLGTQIVCTESYGSSTLTSPFYQEGFEEYIKFMNRLYEAGLLDFASKKNDLAIENKLSMFSAYWAASGTDAVTQVGEGQAPANYVGITCKSEAGNVLAPQDGIFRNDSYAYAVTSQANKEAIGRLLDYLTSDEYVILTDNGIEGWTYEVVDGKIQEFGAEAGNNDAILVSGGDTGLWAKNSIFPRFEITDRDQELVNLANNGYEDKADSNRIVYDNLDDYKFTELNPSTMMALATVEEMNEETEIATELDTYYKELLSKLITGEYSLDDMDTYISDMKKLGLDRLIEIKQARADRMPK